MDDKNIDPDGPCPVCGEPAEKGNVCDFRDQGGHKFRPWEHKRTDGGIIKEWCAEVLEKGDR